MKMPCCASANVPIEKITDYMLSFSHPLGSLKARWFNALGYKLEKPNELAESLLSLASMDVVATVKTDYGTKYVIVGDITGPVGRTASVHSIWILSNGGSVPRLVTAYPSK
jgi:hypothetical protein